jgi:hypothetical protein
MPGITFNLILAKVVTDEKGEFRFIPLGPGLYSLEIRAPLPQNMDCLSSSIPGFNAGNLNIDNQRFFALAKGQEHPFMVRNGVLVTKTVKFRCK